MVSGEHRRQQSSPLVGAQTGWRRTALTCCVVGIMCVSVLLMHAARRTELSVAGHGSLRSRGKKGVRGRGGRSRRRSVRGRGSEGEGAARG